MFVLRRLKHKSLPHDRFPGLTCLVQSVFPEGLGWLRGSSMGVCEALCDMLACKKGYTNKC